MHCQSSRSSTGYLPFLRTVVPAFGQVLLRQLSTLGPFILVTTPYGAAGHFCQLSRSPVRSDYLIPRARAWRLVSEDFLHVGGSFLLIDRTRRIFRARALPRDSYLSQDGYPSIWPGFTTTFVDSYGRRSPGHQVCACTALLNLPAPGRRQPLYISFRFSRDLCF